MDYDRKKRHQLIRVVIAETGMVLSVIAIVIVSIMAAMGFFISGDGKIEQSGLAQIHSLPTGANVELDGTVLFSRTNTSKTMSAGEHYIKLSKDGYDTWANTIKMSPGVLMRLYYPRLFLQDRIVESVMDLTEASRGLEFLTTSSSRNYILYAELNSTIWHLVDARGDEMRVTNLDLSAILPGVIQVSDTTSKKVNTMKDVDELTYRFDGEILETKWSANDEKILAKIKYQEKVSWVLVNLRNVAMSRNLTQEFGLDFDQIEMIDSSANQLFVLENHHLRKINASDGSISRVLVENVEKFANLNSNVIYIAEFEDKKIVATYRDGDEGGTEIATYDVNDILQVALLRYYDEDYLCYSANDKLTIKYGTLPIYRADGTNPVELKDLMVDQKLEATPKRFLARQDSEYVAAFFDETISVASLELGEVITYGIENSAKWLDASMFYAISDGEIIVWDYDGTNKRNLSQSMKSEYGYIKAFGDTVMISANNRYLYYLSRGENSTIELVRERIRD